LKAKKKGIKKVTQITEQNDDWEGMGLKPHSKTKAESNKKTMVRLKPNTPTNELVQYSNPHAVPNKDITSMSRRKE
jgi:hypothetical protein